MSAIAILELIWPIPQFFDLPFIAQSIQFVRFLADSSKSHGAAPQALNTVAR
jgi:hypothetical protein